jgi:hypothetical protein
LIAKTILLRQMSSMVMQSPTYRPGIAAAKGRLAMPALFDSLFFYLGLALLYRFVLERAYAGMIPAEYSYAGFFFAPSTMSTLATYLGVIFIGAQIPRGRSISNIALHAFFLGFYIPLSMTIGVRSEFLDFYGYCTLFMWFLILLCRFIPSKMSGFREIAYANDLVISSSVVVILATLALFISEGGLEYVNFDIEDVYSVRQDINEILTGYVGYLSDWSKNVFLPILLVLAIHWRKFWFFALALFLFGLFFAITSAKAVVVYPIIILLTVFAERRGLLLPTIYIGTTLAAFLGGLFYQVFGQNVLSALILLRAFSVPPSDALLYYQYFQANDHLYWSNTLLGAPFRTVEAEHIAETIGRNTWGYGTETFANTGVFATSFMQFGLFGLLVYPILIALLLKLVDYLTIGRAPMAIATGFTIIPVLLFLGSDLPTTLLSHGFVVMLLLLRLADFKTSNPARLG